MFICDNIKACTEFMSYPKSDFYVYLKYKT